MPAARTQARVEGEKLGGPAQRPHDAEPDQRQVAQVLKVVDLHLAEFCRTRAKVVLPPALGKP
jgi:hypothetical protein